MMERRNSSLTAKSTVNRLFRLPYAKRLGPRKGAGAHHHLNHSRDAGGHGAANAPAGYDYVHKDILSPRGVRTLQAYAAHSCCLSGY